MLQLEKLKGKGAIEMKYDYSDFHTQVLSELEAIGDILNQDDLRILFGF